MKKLLFVLCCLAASTFCYAGGIEMFGDPPNEESKPGNRSQALLPSVDYTDGEVTIFVPYQIDDMAVTIRDDQGVILYSTVIPSITNHYSIVLPDTVDADKYSIQIAYGDIHLIGWF